MNPIKNIILDWSGTLVNDLPPVLAATNKIFEHYHRPPFSEAEFKEKFFLPFQDFYKIYLPELSMDALDALYHESFKLLQENIPLLSHAIEFLEFCRSEDMPIFLLSTIHSKHFDVQGERLGVRAYFTHAYTQAYDKRRTILELLENHQLKAEETLFIGDMVHDIEAARLGNVRSCGVLTGYDSLTKLKKANPDLIFRDLGQVRRYLERHHLGHTEKAPVATVGALIFNPLGQVLMVQTYKWSDLWGIPGGKLKRGETAEEALHREIMEETGLTVTDVCYSMIQDCIDSHEFYKPAHFLLLNYTAQALSEHVVLNDEADNWRWVIPTEALQLPLNQPTRVLLEHWLARQENGADPADEIIIEDLELNVQLGVPDEERREPQKILATVVMGVNTIAEAARRDDLDFTVDYFAISRGIKKLAESQPRKLLETLATEMTSLVLKDPRVVTVTVTLKKFILKDARQVVVKTRRKRNG